MGAAAILKEHISKNGIKQNFVAEKAAMPAELLRRSLDGTRKLQADEFLAICEALSLDIDYFKERAAM
jgi:hypothetical protein